MNRLVDRIAISIGVAFVFAAASFAFVYRAIAVWCPRCRPTSTPSWRYLPQSRPTP